MAITLRSQREIELMRRAGTVVADVLSKLKEIAEPGTTTARLDDVAFEMASDAHQFRRYPSPERFVHR
jgi:methionyl aminopeptidase